MTAIASAIEARQTSGTPRSASASTAPGWRRWVTPARTPHCVSSPKMRFLAEVRSRIRCIRRSSCSSSARSASDGTHTSGTSSRRASSASTRASMRSVLAASGANARARRASATRTVQPTPRSVSAIHAAPLIISTAAVTSSPRSATSRSRPSSSAGTAPSPSRRPAASTAHHAARRVAQSIPTNSTSRPLQTPDTSQRRSCHDRQTTLMTFARVPPRPRPPASCAPAPARADATCRRSSSASVRSALPDSRSAPAARNCSRHRLSSVSEISCSRHSSAIVLRAAQRREHQLALLLGRELPVLPGLAQRLS